MCQEVAHNFGLGHQNEQFDNANTGSCMDYTNAPTGGVVNGFDYGPSNEHPNAHDSQQLIMIYSHTHGTSTSGQAAPGATRGQDNPGTHEAPNDPAAFGRPTGHRDGFGRDSLFEEDLPNGLKRFTHVFWVHPGQPAAPPARGRP